MSNLHPRVQHTHPMGPDGVVRCKHGEQATKMVSGTLANPGREFYVCSRAKSEQCRFWYWADDPIFNLPPPQTQAPSLAAPASQSTATSGLQTPQATPASSSTLRSTPIKRKFSEASLSGGYPSQSSAGSADTPSRRARLEAIQAGLRAREGDQAASQPSLEQTDVLPFTDGVEVVSGLSPASDTDTDVAEVERRPVRFSFLGLPPSQESQAGAAPSTPKKRPPCIADRQQGSFGEGSTSLLTPPQSVKHRANRSEAFFIGSLKPEPVTPTRSKGKERITSQWDQPVEAEQDPFVDTTPSFDAILAAARDADPSFVPTRGESITADMRKLFDAADIIHACTEHLGQLDSFEYIKRLERQRNAFKAANDVKKKRIEELESQLRQKDDIIEAILEKHRTPSAD